MNATHSRPWVKNALDRSSENPATVSGFLSLVRRTEHFTRNYKGVSHAKWLQNDHEYAPTQTGSVICSPLEAVDIECCPPRAVSSQNARRNYERYLALARAEAQIGNTVGAENYYQYAEHYFRSMSSDSERK